ncbi:hypothetical protein PENANT_c041G07841 [Penicillium antarcticum]|uniref:Uncharacterized protein n=1 Tax=Penicillium antarcticum TaxID=416450 RepID=A0A1V6PSR0_9EURO|nr:uncharacterized protein N7508_004671 [Penicillium antarcticum]KAJ5305656.1 hypothetical protein N7508_004671 [Penicillium antarcticum]OQD79971.1 hypothetical protein PENANT_c041G07841 [Penicillium antarcticum]
MGKVTEQSCAPASDPVGDTGPPPYTEHDPQTAGRDLRNVAPSYNRLTGEPTLNATTKFPSAMNGYFQWKLTTIFHLGPTADEKLYAVSSHTTVLSNKPSIVLHDGPTDKHPVIATARGDRWGRTRPIMLTLPTRPESQHNNDIVEEMVPGTLKKMSHTFTFTASVGPKGTSREAFEWRQSHGNEIKELSGHSYGWKLVRLTGPMNTAGGSRKERERGYTSDGLEVVAVIAHNASWSMTKGFRFAFMGSGLTGTLGEIWEILVVLSALEMWYLDVQSSAAAAGSASATSAAAAT